jgi:methionyl aminopeptidase
MASKLKSKNDIKIMRDSGRIAGRILRELGLASTAGVSGNDLDQIARKMLADAKTKSAFLGHHGFPATITVSPNDAVVHGIPNDNPFQEGDIISLDFGTIYRGFVGDNAHTFGIGNISEAAARLLRITEEALDIGIKTAVVGNTTGDIGHAIQSYVESHGYSVVRPLCGHGVGREMWEDPQVPNYGNPGQGPKLKPGMTIAIEPMINAGHEDVKQDKDGWTYRTKDGSLSAHFEHSIAILSDGPEILTSPE